MKEFCGNCGKKLDEMTPEESAEADQEYRDLWGYEPPKNKSKLVRLCDECFELIEANRKWMKENDPDEYTERMVQVYADCKSMEDM